ncbi:hypothetical protein [Brevundimonas sp.]|uniref:hypothetical protein n=1 Tax=Brevundimonas sp. TaxID=1871086 RepID=UPI003D6C8AA8
MLTLTPEQIAAFRRVLDRLTPEDRARGDALAGPAAAAAAAAASHWDFCLPATAVDGLIGDGPANEATAEVRRGLIARWALALPERVAALALPPQSLELYPDHVDRLAAFLEAATGAYDDDYWAKDVRLSLALSVPGAQTQVIDLSSPLGAGGVVRNGRDGYGWSQTPQWIAAQGWRPWLEVHTEARHLSDFTEAGWDRAWSTAAAILKTRPHMAGMIGSSWFYDPPLETISPRLTYLRVNPLKNGAFLLHQGPAEIHSQRAAASSPTRRAMIESGEYTPRSWIVAWPRKALIRWAEARGAI